MGIPIRAFNCVAVGWLVCVAGSHAASVTLTPVADTTLIEFLPANNLGGGIELLGGTSENLTRHRPLVKFDVAGNLPAGSLVVGAQLVIEVTKVPQNGFAFADYGLHRMLKDWGEGDKLSPTNCTSCAGWGSPATANEATWLDAFSFAPGDWTAPGADPTNDFVAVAGSVTTIYKESDNPYTFGSTGALTADVQQWLDLPATNFGWMLLCQAEGTAFSARRFGAREHPLSPPRLQISFLVPPAFDRLEKLPGQFNLYFTQLPDQNYRVESRTGFGTVAWQTFATFPANGLTNSVIVADVNPAAQRYFRLVTY